MKKICKTAVLFALGVASITAVKAQQSTAYNHDLIVGFTVANGNDLIYDLGATNLLTNGQYWNLGSYLKNAGLSNQLASVQWGVIGGGGPANGGSSLNGQRFIYTTAQTTPSVTITGKITWGNDLSGIGNIYGNFTNAGAGNFLTIAFLDTSLDSWYEQTTFAGAGDNSAAYFNDIGQDPNSTGPTSATFYQLLADNSAPSPIGTFTLSSTGVLTYNTLSVSVSTNAYLTSLVLNPAGLTSTFVSNNFSYLATNAYNNMPTVTVVNADLTATNKLIYGGTTNPLASSVASSGLALTLGVTNVVKVQVTAPDGVTVNTYQVNVIELPNLATAPKLTNSVNSGKLILSWPSDRLGFRLLVQTNNLAKGISSNTNDWATVPGSTAKTTNSIPIVSTNNGFYRLVYP